MKKLFLNPVPAARASMSVWRSHFHILGDCFVPEFQDLRFKMRGKGLICMDFRPCRRQLLSFAFNLHRRIHNCSGPYLLGPQGNRTRRWKDENMGCGYLVLIDDSGNVKWGFKGHLSFTSPTWFFREPALPSTDILFDLKAKCTDFRQGKYPSHLQSCLLLSRLQGVLGVALCFFA